MPTTPSGSAPPGFGDLLPEAAKVTPPANPTLKDPRTFTLIGTDRVRRKEEDKKKGTPTPASASS